MRVILPRLARPPQSRSNEQQTPTCAAMRVVGMCRLRRGARPQHRTVSAVVGVSSRVPIRTECRSVSPSPQCPRRRAQAPASKISRPRTNVPTTASHSAWRTAITVRISRIATLVKMTKDNIRLLSAGRSTRRTAPAICPSWRMRTSDTCPRPNRGRTSGAPGTMRPPAPGGSRRPSGSKARGRQEGRPGMRGTGWL